MDMSLEKVSSFAPLPIRVLAGIAPINHDLPKYENTQGTQGFFGSIHDQMIFFKLRYLQDHLNRAFQ